MNALTAMYDEYAYALYVRVYVYECTSLHTCTCMCITACTHMYGRMNACDEISIHSLFAYMAEYTHTDDKDIYSYSQILKYSNDIDTKPTCIRTTRHTTHTHTHAKDMTSHVPQLQQKALANPVL